MNRTISLVTAVIAAAMVSLVGYGVGVSTSNDPAPVASSLDKDTAYLTFLRAKDVGTTSNADAIEMGHRVASAIRDEHINGWLVGTRLVTLGYTGDEAATIVGAAIAVYAPEFSSSVE